MYCSQWLVIRLLKLHVMGCRISFSYKIWLEESTITESSGSSSMASVCGLAMMDAGRLHTLLHCDATQANVCCKEEQWQQLHGLSLRRLPGHDGCR